MRLVYYSFPDTTVDIWQFSLGYLENFLRYYLAFYLRQPELPRLKISGDELMRLASEARTRTPSTKTLEWLMTIYRSMERRNHVLPQQDVLIAPRSVSDFDDTTIVMFLDEFQNTRLPQYQFDIVGFMQDAVESPTCPHFVTGSAMSILAREIIGRGSLFGRFRSHPITPLSEYWGAALALRTAQYYRVNLPEVMAPVVASRCGGNPFYITAVVQQASEQRRAITDEGALNELLAIDISSGFIWGELHDQVTRWIERINEFGVTKWILYLSALEEGDRISLERIQQELRARDGKDVPIATIRDVLVKLSRGDLVEYLELGGWFRKIDDPILLEFLKVWGKTEVEGQPSSQVHNDLLEQYQKLTRRISEYKGYLAEVFLMQVLVNGQRHTLPGRLFHSAEDVTMPPRFVFIHHRQRLGAGKGKEIDVLGAAGGEVWVCQSKWVERDPVGVTTVQELLKQAEVVKEEMHPHVLRLWLFAYRGLTQEAAAFAREHGIFWSHLDDLNELLQSLGLRPLPELAG